MTRIFTDKDLKFVLIREIRGEFCLISTTNSQKGDYHNLKCRQNPALTACCLFDLAQYLFILKSINKIPQGLGQAGSRNC